MGEANIKPVDEEPIQIGDHEELVEKTKIGKPDSSDQSKFAQIKAWYLDRKKWAIPVTVLVLLLIIAGLPVTRYGLAGLVIKQDVSVKVLDASANTPVSGATISLGGLSAQTDGSGVAKLNHIKAGPHNVTISKKYYKDKTAVVSVPILGHKAEPQFTMTATGRQVKITVTNLINKKPLDGVSITVADVTAKTDKDGNATVVLAAGTTSQKAKLSLDGYNDQTADIKVSNSQIEQNKLSLTPAGRVYFLSKLSGTVDVVKTNLDGTDRQTVLAGTGNEDDRNTVLLASRDWKYLALSSRRAGSSPSLYLIDTSDDSLTTMDQGSLDFSLTGWVGDDFVYTTTDSSLQLWQANRQAIKSYNAQTKKSTTLDQTTASGTGASDYVSQLVGDVYGYDDQIFYIMNWTSAFSASSSASLASKQSTFNSIKPDGSAKKAIKSFGLADGTTGIDVSVNSRAEKPDVIELAFSDGTKDNFYTYQDGQVKADPNATADSFYTAAPTYLESPSGNSSFWAEPRDGKNTLFIGDEDGGSSKQIATLSDYNTYGWYTDDYVLVSKNSSELYIMPVGGSVNPIKISDYHKPDQTFSGYGGGYGGL